MKNTEWQLSKTRADSKGVGLTVVRCRETVGQRLCLAVCVKMVDQTSCCVIYQVQSDRPALVQPQALTSDPH